MGKKAPETEAPRDPILVSIENDIRGRINEEMRERGLIVTTGSGHDRYSTLGGFSGMRTPRSWGHRPKVALILLERGEEVE